MKAQHSPQPSPIEITREGVLPTGLGTNSSWDLIGLIIQRCGLLDSLAVFRQKRLCPNARTGRIRLRRGGDLDNRFALLEFTTHFQCTIFLRQWPMVDPRILQLGAYGGGLHAHQYGRMNG